MQKNKNHFVAKTNFVLLFLSAALALLILAFFSIKAAIVTSCLIPPFIILFYISNKAKNLVLLCFVSFFAFANLVGVPHAILNANTYQYSGWKAVKAFDFSYIQFANVYTLVFLSVILLAAFIYTFEKIKPSHFSSILVYQNSAIDYRKKSSVKSIASTVLIIILLTVVVFVSIVGFEYRIGLSGVEPDKLPWKLVGLLHYGRSLIIPFVILWLFQNTNANLLFRIFIIFCAFTIGIFSGSRGSTLFYLLPLILYNWQSFRFGTVIFKLVLLILGFSIATASQAIYTLIPGLSWHQQIKTLFEMGFDPYNSIGGNLFEFANQILGIAHRFYGFQDYVLAYQSHGSIMPLNFLSFLLHGNPESIIPNITSVLYGLEFPEGSSFGVAMGWIGLSVATFNSSILIALLLTLYLALIIVLTNRFLLDFQTITLIRNFEILYFAMCLIVSFILISGRIDFFYMVICILIITKTLLKYRLKSFNILRLKKI